MVQVVVCRLQAGLCNKLLVATLAAAQARVTPQLGCFPIGALAAAGSQAPVAPAPAARTADVRAGVAQGLRATVGMPAVLSRGQGLPAGLHTHHTDVTFSQAASPVEW